MLNFGYALDNELRVPPDSTPSGVQTQAFEIAVNRISQRYANIKRLLLQNTPTGAPAIAGLNPQWQARLKASSTFVAALPDRLMEVAYQIAQGDAGNAATQGSLALLWNRWAPEALQVYNETVKAFEQDVQKGMANQAIGTMPAVYVKMAAVAKTDAPLVPTVGTSLSGLDAYYGGGLEVLGLVAMASYAAAALGGWWLWKKLRKPTGS